MELESPRETQPYLFSQTKIQIWERGRKRFREERDWCDIPYTNLCCIFLLCLMLLSLSVPLFFVFSLCLCRVCVHLLSFFFFSSSSFFYFFLVRASLSIYREIPKKLLPYFSLNWSDHGGVASVFLFTTPNFMLSRDPLFHLLLFLFVPLLFKLPLFGLWRPDFSTFQAHFHEILLLTLWCCHFPFTFQFFFCFFVLLD